MIDSDLAELYGVETGQLTRQVRRNIKRFPDDFMFRLTKEEFDDLRCHFDTSSWGGRRYAPYAFTEHGVAMLSSVLNSERAIVVNIQIIRTFTRLRELLATNEALRRKVEEMERKYDEQFKVIFEVMKQLLTEEENPKRELGFRP